MDFIYHKKVMEKLETIERKIDRANDIYTKEYLIINRYFMQDLIIITCIVSLIVLSIGSYFNFI
jgi:hypothetical protein